MAASCRPTAKYLPGASKRVHGPVETLHGVLADGLFEAEHVGLQGPGEHVLFDGEAQLIFVHHRPRRGPQTVLVARRLLQFWIAGETQGIGRICTTVELEVLPFSPSSSALR